MEKLRHLHGMRDLPQESWRRQQTAHDQLREFFFLHGYQVLETPLLEPTELFLRKSGGDLAARMYTFTDPGGNQASLRPEYTASIVRHYLEQDSATPLPLRAQYAGPVFRYEEGTSADRQFTQIGAELLGSSSPRADAEVLSLSIGALSTLGLKGHVPVVGDLGILHSALEQLGLSERAIMFVLTSIGELKTGAQGLDTVLERARQLHVLSTDSRLGRLNAAVAGMEDGEARQLLHGLVEWVEAGALGQREPSDVVERLLRKFRGSDDPESFQKGLELASKIVQVRGEYKRCLSEVGQLMEAAGLTTDALGRLREIIDLLDEEQMQSSEIELDFGLARGLAYYTGIVFEIRHPNLGTALGGGGRYDGLARALGAPLGVPALGFAYSLDGLLAALDEHGSWGQERNTEPGTVLVVAPTDEAYKHGLRLARELRHGGTPVEIEVSGRSIEESVSYAKSSGIPQVISVDGNGNHTSHQTQAVSGGSG